MTLTEFLLARIAEDERQASQPHLERPQYGVFGEGYDVEGSSVYYGHYLTIDPGRVLAECAAKRRMVVRSKWIEKDPWMAHLHDTAGQFEGAEATLCDLASVYADHPDYDEAWRL